MSDGAPCWCLPGFRYRLQIGLSAAWRTKPLAFKTVVENLDASVLQYENQKMVERFSTMNDSKWCRLLAAIVHIRLPVSYWRFLDDDREYRMPTPWPDLVVEHNGKRGIGDYRAMGPFFFRDVESVRWPATYSRNWFRGCAPVLEQQPLEQLSAALDQCGKFDYTLDDAGLTLFAYRRRKADDDHAQGKRGKGS